MKWVVPVQLVVCLCGCSSPVSTVVKLGMRVAGKAIVDDETNKLAAELAGQPPSAADEVLGAPKDVWHDLNGPREWRTYPVKYDVLDQKRYVVGVERNRIALVEMMQKHGSEADIPLELLYFAKVKDESPEECEAKLGFGPPVLSARSLNTRELLQLYDARLITELPTPHDAILRFDEQDRCKKLDLVEVEASAR